MTKLLLIVFSLILISIDTCSQTKKPSDPQGDYLKNGMLAGKWRSEEDTQVVLVFGKEKYVGLYGKDTTDNLFFKLSGSCNLKDNSTKIELKKAYLLFFSKDSVEQCVEILNLSNTTLSWINDKNGRISVFDKIK